MQKKIEITITGFIGTTIRIHSFIPGKPKPKVSDRQLGFSLLKTDVKVSKLQVLLASFITTTVITFFGYSTKGTSLGG